MSDEDSDADADLLTTHVTTVTDTTSTSTTSTTNVVVLTMQPLAAQDERRRLQSEELCSIVEEIHFYPVRVVLCGTPGCLDVYFLAFH